jgi:hypothetical protein
MRIRRIRLAVGAAGTACAAVTLLSPPAQAAISATEHSSYSPVGEVFSCQGGDLTVQTGSAEQVFHSTIDNTGTYHFTGTIVPHAVTLTDAQGDLYSLSGAAWIGGSGPNPAAPIVFTDTDHFVIRNASGGVYAKVQLVIHTSPNGTGFTFDLGSCLPPA